MQMLADEEIWRVADALQPEIHFEGDLIIREGDTDSDSMYFIEEGTVSISCSTRGGATGGGWKSFFLNFVFVDDLTDQKVQARKRQYRR